MDLSDLCAVFTPKNPSIHLQISYGLFDLKKKKLLEGGRGEKSEDFRIFNMHVSFIITIFFNKFSTIFDY